MGPALRNSSSELGSIFGKLGDSEEHWGKWSFCAIIIGWDLLGKSLGCCQEQENPSSHVKSPVKTETQIDRVVFPTSLFATLNLFVPMDLTCRLDSKIQRWASKITFMNPQKASNWVADLAQSLFWYRRKRSQWTQSTSTEYSLCTPLYWASTPLSEARIASTFILFGQSMMFR